MDRACDAPALSIATGRSRATVRALPWNVRYLREIHGDEYREWIRHVQTVLPELDDIRVVEREDDRHAYLMLRYANGVEIPSWMTSDGTLKLLALTLFAYLPVAESYPSDRRFLHEVILIEEAGRRRSPAGARCDLRFVGLGI